MDKIYIVETASYNPKSCEWDNQTSVKYFRSKVRAVDFCERWMANYKKDYPDGAVRISQTSTADRYYFNFADGSIEEYEIYAAELN